MLPELLGGFVCLGAVATCPDSCRKEKEEEKSVRRGSTAIQNMSVHFGHRMKTNFNCK